MLQDGYNDRRQSNTAGIVVVRRRNERAKRARLAERVGFEPTVEFPLHTLSKRAPSTTRTSLHFRINGLRTVWNSVAQNPPSNPAAPQMDLSSAICALASTNCVGNCVRPSNVVRSLRAIS